MKKLIIQLDFISGPLWKDVFDRENKKLVTGIKVIDEDQELDNLNHEIQKLYSSFYKINYNNQPVYFDKEEEKLNKEKMLTLLHKLTSRIHELNDGSFTVEDLETLRVRNL